jgi:ribosomal subunit interface protein
MNIQLRALHVKVPKRLQRHVERRMGFELSRFGARIGRITLRFSEGDIHHGVPEKRCQINVGFRPNTIRVEDSDADAFIAFDRAAHHASRAIERAIDRKSWSGHHWAFQRIAGRLDL